MYTAKIKIIFRDCGMLELEAKYTYIVEVFNAINSALILNNRTENDVLNMRINFIERT